MFAATSWWDVVFRSLQNGFAYNFELYAGKDDNVLLARIVPSDNNHKSYFDNYFNSPHLQIHLASKGILSLRTVEWTVHGDDASSDSSDETIELSPQVTVIGSVAGHTGPSAIATTSYYDLSLTASGPSMSVTSRWVDQQRERSPPIRDGLFVPVCQSHYRPVSPVDQPNCFTDKTGLSGVFQLCCCTQIYTRRQFLLVII